VTPAQLHSTHQAISQANYGMHSILPLGITWRRTSFLRIIKEPASSPTPIVRHKTIQLIAKVSSPPPDLLPPNRKRETKKTILTNSIHHATQSSGLPVLWVIYVHVLRAGYVAERWNPTDDLGHFADLSFSLCRKATPKTAEVEWRVEGSEESV
jgi:hypothetical protein